MSAKGPSRESRHVLAFTLIALVAIFCQPGCGQPQAELSRDVLSPIRQGCAVGHAQCTLRVSSGRPWGFDTLVTGIASKDGVEVPFRVLFAAKPDTSLRRISPLGDVAVANRLLPGACTHDPGCDNSVIGSRVYVRSADRNLSLLVLIVRANWKGTTLADSKEQLSSVIRGAIVPV